MKKILILTADKTGSGHKSSSNAISKQLTDRGFEVRQIDVFTLMGRFGRFLEESYIPATTRTPWFFFILERTSQYFPDIIHTMMYHHVARNMEKQIRDYDPDLIISVHCMFTKAISTLLRRKKLDIPFCIGVVDLIKPPSVWMDKNADLIFVPTPSIKEDYVRKGLDPERVIVSGFPVRDDIIVRRTPKKVEDTINILMVNSSVNLKKNIRFLKEVSRLENISITYICGLDERLHEELLQRQKDGDIGKDVTIYGFVKNMNEFLNRSHIILTKAGPNVIIEAVRSDTAVVITGHIKGQEDHNYEYIVDNGFGICCEDPERIYDELKQMIDSGRLQEILANITRHMIDNGAEVIANRVESLLGR